LGHGTPSVSMGPWEHPIFN